MSGALSTGRGTESAGGIFSGTASIQALPQFTHNHLLLLILTDLCDSLCCLTWIALPAIRPILLHDVRFAELPMNYDRYSNGATSFWTTGSIAIPVTIATMKYHQLEAKMILHMTVLSINFTIIEYYPKYCKYVPDNRGSNETQIQFAQNKYKTSACLHDSSTASVHAQAQPISMDYITA